MKIEGLTQETEDAHKDLGYDQARPSALEIEQRYIEEILKSLEIPEEELD